MNTSKKPSTYVLLTAARNEEGYIENTLDSVVRQTVKPIKWIIVSDGSTDRTEDIVSKYVKEYPFIKLIRFERKVNSAERNFGVKALVIKYGYQY